MFGRWAGGFAGGVVTLIYQLDLADGDLTAEAGTDPTFTRTSTIYGYATSGNSESITAYTTGNAAIPTFADKLNTTSGGMWFPGAIKNWALQSEAPATTWTTVGTPTSVNDSVGTWGDVTYGTIVAAATGDGITQTVGYAAASNRSMGYVWMKVASGVLQVDLTLEGVGATPETVTKTVYVTDTLRRYWVFNNFTAAATGNVTFSIVCKAAGTLQLSGMQVSDLSDANFQDLPVINSYAKTTTVAANTTSDVVDIGASALDVTEGTLMFWYRPDFPSNHVDASIEQGQGYNTILVANGDKFSVLYSTVSAPGLSLVYNGTATGVSGSGDPSNGQYIQPSEWAHYTLTWSHDGTNINTEMFRNGVSLGTATLVKAVPTGITNVYLGQYYSTAGSLSAHGHIAYLKIHNVVLSDANILAEYNAHASEYELLTYEYGYPAGGRQEDNVKAQWLFDEGSGNIVDEVSGITLTKYGANAADYNQSITGAWANLSPGILLNTDQEYFANRSAVSQLDLGTSDFVVEWVRIAPNGTNNANNREIIDCRDTSNNFGWRVAHTMSTSSQLQLTLKATDGTTVNSTLSTSATWIDGNPHKFRLVGNRAGSATFYIDGVSQGTITISTLSGKTIQANTVTLGCQASSGTFANFWSPGTWIELRVSIGDVYNNSGGPAGG